MLLTVVVAAVALLASGCAASVDGQAFASSAVTAGIDPGFVQGNDGGDDDRLAAAVLHDLETFWGGEFPALAGGARFTPLKGYFSVDSSRDGPGPPCTQSASEVEGNAFYCPRADIIAYDRASLLPVLRQKFGDSAVAVVLAHEFGHSVQQRLEASSANARRAWAPGRRRSCPRARPTATRAPSCGRCTTAGRPTCAPARRASTPR